jgi:hypothetical protein
MKLSRISCDSCHLSVEGDLHVPALARLSGEEMRLAEALVMASGNLKELGAELGISYPTLRKRLDQVIARLRDERARDQGRIDDILRRIEAGETDAEDGIRAIREIRNDL